MSEAEHIYLIAVGSNMRIAGVGEPRRVVERALAALGEGNLTCKSRGPVVATDPLGPSQRRYANSAAVVQTPLDPEAMLTRLQAIESAFERKRRGVRWRSRTLDLDIILWSGGAYHSERLEIPHPEFRHRDFVLAPAVTVAPEWRDPVSGLTLRQLHARLTKRRSPRR
ncbi:2-amino-4-hydroxy-6-hydroxymethyldihydropteridine diphosphokinase [Qipengyuania atrilutea]|uniref:2-amino-4-hydroxy-6-hydroxymethyldihydropteridine pyrophosphokinase n=1 Tax=Qipengyuania atrilutea TaxID=2744473 RepID=A0A850H5Y0_9SPHN|nr:2-amino-4-hydroxy-6-hydroxymethyldihydropteridine diphosphokinase [Actirhodobacter atriluteus]NVD46100.1 2-amino-4-hydroxy-6-hydroxymethyldihydropteridine diphosphokinase [Actirhodobacter atriluteus]